jgi:hypothetical protein
MDASPDSSVSDLVTLRLALAAEGRHPLRTEEIALSTYDVFVLGRGPVNPPARSFEPFEIAFHSLLADTAIPREILRIFPVPAKVDLHAVVGRRGNGPFVFRLNGQRLEPDVPSAEEVSVSVPRSRTGFVLDVAPSGGGRGLTISASFGEAGIPTDPTTDVDGDLVRRRLIALFNNSNKHSQMMRIALVAANPRGGAARSLSEIVRDMEYAIARTPELGKGGEYARSVFGNVFVWMHKPKTGTIEPYLRRDLPDREKWILALRELELEGVAADELLPPAVMGYTESNKLLPLAELAQKLHTQNVLTEDDLPLARQSLGGEK